MCFFFSGFSGGNLWLLKCLVEKKIGDASLSLWARFNIDLFVVGLTCLFGYLFAYLFACLIN